jgi:hypothetical protein
MTLCGQGFSKQSVITSAVKNLTRKPTMTNPISDLDEVVRRITDAESLKYAHQRFNAKTSTGLVALAFIRQNHAAIRRAFEDAERWRAIIATRLDRFVRNNYGEVSLNLPGGMAMLEGDKLDAAIDAAMQATAPKLHCSSGPETELNLGADAARGSE